MKRSEAIELIAKTLIVYLHYPQSESKEEIADEILTLLEEVQVQPPPTADYDIGDHMDHYEVYMWDKE